MAFAYVGNNSAAASAATEIDLGVPAGVAAGEIIVAVYAFEGVASGSGPWIVPNLGQLATDYIGPSTGWQQVCWQGPSASGVGIEVWSAIFFTGGHQWAKFASSQNAVGVCVAYSGENNQGNPVLPNSAMRLATTAQVVGHQPAAPAVAANAGELIVACGGDLMSAGFGSPSGFTSRVDATRSGAGTVEAVIADATIGSVLNTGPITFPNNAASSTTAGTTATLAIRPAPTTGGVGGVIEAPLPPDLVVPGGWTFRFTAIDPVTGVTVGGVKVSEANIVATDTSEGGGGGGDLGPYMLVPGPDA